MDKDIQRQEENRAELSTLGTAAGSSISLLALFRTMPSEPNVGSLPATTESIIRKTANELKFSLVRDFATAEQALLSKGWETSCMNGKRFWHAPQGLSFSPSDGCLWSDRAPGAQGKTIIAEQELVLLRAYSLRFGNGISGHNSGIIYDQVLRLNTIGNVTLTFEQIGSLEKKLADGKLSASDALLKPGAFLRFVDRTARYENLNHALSVAQKELAAQEERYVAAQKAARANIGVVLGGAAINTGINRIAFASTPMSLQSEAITTLNPFVAMTNLRWQSKLAVMVGSVAVSRTFDLVDANSRNRPNR